MTDQTSAPTETTTTTIFEMSSRNLERLTKKVDSLNRKAHKLGVAPLSMTVLSSEMQERKKNGVKYAVEVFTVELLGSSPRLEDWTLLAKIESFDGDTNLVRSFAEFDMPEYRTGKMVCEHCGIDRFRKNTFVLADAAGDRIQVGSSCLGDFIRNQNAEQIAMWYAWVDDLGEFNGVDDEDDDFYGSSGGGSRFFSTVDYLVFVNRSIANNGYGNSRSEYPTKWDALNDMFDPKTSAPTDEERNTVKVQLEKIITHIRNLPTLSDFDYNLVTLAEAEYIESKHAGYVAYIPVYVQKFSEEAVQDALPENSKQVSNWIGEIGQKISGIEVTLVANPSIDTAYGRATIYKFVDENGNAIVWFTSSIIWNADGVAANVGEKYIITRATIKNHNVYNNEKQTNILRPKFEQVVESEVEND